MLWWECWLSLILMLRNLSRYSFGGSSSNLPFVINDQGEIRVSNDGELDFESTSSFTFGTTVSDGEFSDTASVTVNINKVDEAPTLSNETLTIASNAANGTQVGSVNFDDPEGDGVTLEIIEGNVDGDQDGELAFAIAPSGTITVSDATELTNTASFSLVVEASQTDNPQLSNRATISVNVTTPSETDLSFGSLEGDTLDSSNGQILFSGAGADRIEASGGEGNNRLYGGSGDDVMITGMRDRAFAGAGNDDLTGAGSNRLYGGEGNDLFRIGASNNSTVFGGAGNDNFLIADRDFFPDEVNTIMDFTPGEDSLLLDRPSLSFEADIALTSEDTSTVVVLRIAGLNQEQPLARLLGVATTDLGAEDFEFDVASLI